MKTFAYLALIGSAMAVRLMQDDTPTVEDAATIEDIEGLTLEDLEAEQEGLGDCFLEKTKEMLDEASMTEEEVEAVADDLVAGAEEGKVLGEAVEHLRAIGEEHDYDRDEQDAFLGEILRRVKKCAGEKKGDRKEKKPRSDDEGDDLELAQEGTDLEDAAQELKAAWEDLDSEEQDAVKAEVRDKLGDEAEAVLDAAKEGAVEELKARFAALPPETQEALKEGARELKAAKEEMDGESDGDDDGEGPRGPKRAKKDE